MNGSRSGCNVIIIGFSATGKSQIAPRVAAALGWEWLDTDIEIVKIAGKGIEDIFAQDGEPRFRALERQALEAACRKRSTVISVGGGAAVSTENRELMRRAGMVVLLEARPETIYQRLQKDSAEGASIRPLLAGADPLQRIRELKQSRQSSYDAAADWTVHTDDLSTEEAALEVVRGWRYWSRSRCGDVTAAEGAPAVVVVTATQSYPVYVGWGILETLGREMRKCGLSGSAFVVSDETVAHIYGQRVRGFLRDAGFRASILALPPGETAKTLDNVSKIYDFLVKSKAERGDVVVAFGGGVVGDIAGYAAATFLRGMCVVQVPTTLVGMVDSSIGGKVGVDHPRGKNLIGAFHQPSLVLADVQLLTTLPERELASGWAEVIKHGLILDAEFFALLNDRAGALMALEEESLVRAISCSTAIKAGVVAEDERETSGRRTLLNYGHTIAHGIEAATGYKRFLHGEAVAIGMVGAAMLSQRMGLVGPEVVAQHRSLLEKFRLPVSCPDVERKAVLRAMELDKKVKEGAIRWVLLEGIGKAVLRSDVPVKHVREVLAELGIR
ncbi:MAG: 3-dehydroquinate synthase [Chloroflexota bacterium]